MHIIGSFLIKEVLLFTILNNKTNYT